MYCVECKRNYGYKFELCWECFENMYSDEIWKVTKAYVINSATQEQLDSNIYGYQLMYSMVEGGEFEFDKRGYSYLEKCDIIEQFQKTGKIKLKRTQLFSRKEEFEEIEPVTIQFSKPEIYYAKNHFMIQHPAGVEMKKVWVSSDLNRFNEEARDLEEKRMFDRTLSTQHYYRQYVELCKKWGMNVK
jgi:hypothetical protein